MNIDNLPPLKEVIKKYSLRAKKNLGQNFLLDLNLTSRIARSAGRLEGFIIIEVGPGPGGLTRALLAQGADKVIVIERDERALPALQEISDAYPNQLEIIIADALKIDFASLTTRPAKIVANLPYNIATPLLTGWLTSAYNSTNKPFFDSLTLMFQKEVALRICAKPKSKAYGRLSVLCSWLTDANIMFNVDKSAFTPPPKVTSSIVHLLPKEIERSISLNALENVTRATFGQRRKMIRQSLKGLNIPVDELLKITGLSGKERAEELEVSTFLKLAKAITNY